MFISGKYKVEVFDQIRGSYVPTPSGFGMRVEVLDPHQEMMLSRVRSLFKHHCCECIIAVTTDCIIAFCAVIKSSVKKCNV